MFKPRKSFGSAPCLSHSWAWLILFLPLLSAPESLLVDPMEAIYPDVRPPALASSLAAPRGGTLLLQVAFIGMEHPSNLEGFDLVDNGTVVSGVQSYRVDSVPVEQNTGLSHGTEIRDGKVNPWVIRKAPFHIGDPLIPMGSKQGRLGSGLSSNGTLVSSYAVRWAIPEGANPGARECLLVSRLSGGLSLTNRFTLHVYPVTIPAAEKGTFPLIQTSRTVPITNHYKVPLWSDAFWDLYGKYARTLVEGRQSTGRILLPELARDCTTGREPEFGARLDRMFRTLLSAGMRDFLGVGIFYPILPRDKNNPKWGVLSYKDTLFGTPEGDGKARALFAQIRQVLASNQLTSRYRMQVYDEVPESDNALYVRAAKMMREEIPGVKIYEVINSPNLAIAESVDEWCPLVNVYLFRQDFFEERKAKGAKVSIYTCTGPGGAWVNRLLDMERSRCALIPWFVYGYGLSGFLHWGANSWMADPFAQSVVPTGSGDASRNFLPAGDTHILYPGPEGPVISLRYEAQRLGAEDYEALAILGKKNPDGAKSLVFRNFPRPNDGPRDGAAYWPARHELLAAASFSGN